MRYDVIVAGGGLVAATLACRAMGLGTRAAVCPGAPRVRYDVIVAGGGLVAATLARRAMGLAGRVPRLALGLRP